MPSGTDGTVAARRDPTGLLAPLDRLHARVADLVTRRSRQDPTASDPMRGLFLTEDAVAHALATRGAGLADTGPAPRPPAAGLLDEDSGGALHALARRFALSPFDTQVLLIALAPDLERGFEPLYGYLNDDVSRRRATVGLALDLCGIPESDPAARGRFRPHAPLGALGLLRVEEPERPFLSRSLRAPDRVVAHLLGDDTSDDALADRLHPLPAPFAPDPSDTLRRRLAARLASAPLTVYVREARQGDGAPWVSAALAEAGLKSLLYRPDAASPPPGAGHPSDPAAGPQVDGRSEPWRDLLREARLRDCAVVVHPLPEAPGPVMRALSADDVPVLFVDGRPYDPAWCDADPLVVDAPRPATGGTRLWRAELGDTALAADLDLGATLAPYRLGSAQSVRAARAALRLAALDGGTLDASHVRLAARQQAASGLERHARRIRPAVGWDDLVLPPEPLARLRELAARARFRERVLGEWRLSAGGGRGRGVLGLFAGDSGTGKTHSAEVVAAELGLDLYVVQLSSVVDKYVGETEKNLERIFAEADVTDSVLLFDEADAVFGKRSDVKDSHDKYANMESAYLLQRLEAFDGIALLTTNLRANIDDAFTRRLDVVVDFPFPDADQRLALWRHSLRHVPCAEGIDPTACARQFELAGGSIRGAVVTAAYAAATRGSPVTEADLLEGARREYRKAGRLVMAGPGSL
ncbi:ATP-binding protein [Streptomyces sp. NRRL S-1521]|uniref:ATP-binding protein n=1 Tax=Streptomyces sp. NRRL S-1521 TaxID=1609100 RepID=UPI000747FB76|nr:AAA family ATPase [Streptomyces sp. NRRL S-1521]